MTIPELRPSQVVRVVQMIAARDGAWQTEVRGRVVSASREPTGSWFAHGRNGRLWLDRLRIQKADGEIADLVLDRESVVTILDEESGRTQKAS
jgi:hypothetical protein